MRVSELPTTSLSGYNERKSQQIWLPYQHLPNTHSQVSGPQTLLSYHLFHKLHKVPDCYPLTTTLHEKITWEKCDNIRSRILLSLLFHSLEFLTNCWTQDCSGFKRGHYGKGCTDYRIIWFFIQGGNLKNKTKKVLANPCIWNTFKFSIWSSCVAFIMTVSRSLLAPTKSHLLCYL